MSPNSRFLRPPIPGKSTTRSKVGFTFSSLTFRCSGSICAISNRFREKVSILPFAVVEVLINGGNTDTSASTLPVKVRDPEKKLSMYPLSMTPGGGGPPGTFGIAISQSSAFINWPAVPRVNFVDPSKSAVNLASTSITPPNEAPAWIFPMSTLMSPSIPSCCQRTKKRHKPINESMSRSMKGNCLDIHTQNNHNMKTRTYFTDRKLKGSFELFRILHT